MTNIECARVLAYLEAGCGKSLTAESKVVYFELLGDLSFEVGMIAARRVLAEHRWHSFPTIAEFREAAVATMRGEVMELSESEAWSLAWRIAQRTDPELSGSFDRACRLVNAPPIVIEAIQTFGLLNLCYGKEPVGVIRGQFLKVFGQLAARQRRLALMPPSVAASLSSADHRPLPSPVRQAIEGFVHDVP